MLDDLIKRRPDELLPQKLEEKLAELREKKPASMTIIATIGTLDWAYRPILASTAAAVFFTFYGLNLLKKDISDLRSANAEMPMEMPFGPD